MILTEAAIVIECVTKKFEDVTAVNGLSLTVDKGELFGLLGPNGAGKTTTINMLCGLLELTSGSVRVGGCDVQKEPNKVKKLIGVSSQETAVYPHLTGRENIELFGNLHAMPREKLKGNVDELLQRLSLREHATLFMTLLAAFKALLCRYTGQTDILVGTPIAGRTQTQTENVIGFFANTLVMRTDLSGDPTYRELLARVREVSLAAYAHQHIPFEKLVQELRPERLVSHTPLFQVN